MGKYIENKDGEQSLPKRSEELTSMVLAAMVDAAAHKTRTDVHHVLLALLSHDPYTQTVFSMRNKEDLSAIVNNLIACIQGQEVHISSQHKPGELMSEVTNILNQATHTAAREHSPRVYPRHVLRAIFMQQPTNYYAHLAVSRQLDMGILMQNFARYERRHQ